MKGNISYIKKGSYGFINGEDLLEYFFDKDGLKNCTIYQLSEGDYVEFKIEIQLGQKRDKAVDIIKKSSTSYRSTDIAEPGIHPDFVFDAFNEDEKLIIEQLKKELYLTNGGGSIPIGRSDYRYCLVKPTRDFNLTFNLNREIVVVFADYVSFEPRSLDVAAVVANEPGVEVSVYGMDGRLRMVAVTDASGRASLSGLAEGAYMVVVRSESEVKTFKLIR